MNKLIITADDCGLSNGINLATLDLFQKGIVTDASVMTNCTAAQHAISLFAPCPGLKLGVHLNLTDGLALQVRKSSSLTRPDGRFRTKLNLLARSLAPNQAFLSLVEMELAAQIDVLIQAGVQPKHLSAHIQFHLVPALRKIVFRLSESYGIEWVRPYRLRYTVIPLNPLRSRRPRLPRRDALEPAQGPDYIVVLMYWMNHRPEELVQMMETLPGTTELVVHPCSAHDNSFPERVSYPPQERFKEMRYLEQLWQLLH